MLSLILPALSQLSEMGAVWEVQIDKIMAVRKKSID